MGMGSSCCNYVCVLYFLVLLLLNATQYCFSFVQTQTLCHDDERSALLQFKQSFTIDNSASDEASAYPKVASWNTQAGDHERSNCCSWDGVECDEDSGHVIGLDLSSSCLRGSVNSSSSLFQLAHLHRLDLSDNNFISSEIPSRLGHDLTSLRYLNLSNTLFSGQIPSEISKLSKLSTLDLSSTREGWLQLTEANLRRIVQNLTNIKQLHLSMVVTNYTLPDIIVNASSLTSLRLDECGLQGQFPVGIFHLPNLEVLDLHENDLTGYFPDDLNISSPLKELNVGMTNFFGHLPASIGNLRSLNLLDLSSCKFVGELPCSVGNLTQLTKLYLGHNQITGQIPSSLTKLTQLTVLVLRFNNLHGPIPRSLFHHLQNLEYLDLSKNNLSGVVEFDEFSKLQKVRELRLSSNKLSVQIKTSFKATAPQFEVLMLDSCNLTKFPEFLNDQYKLQELDLSDNQIHGQIPKWMWNATRDALRYLSLARNFLTGFEHNPGTLPWQNLYILDLGFNRLQGSLPIPPPSISVYSVTNNNYTGQIPPSFCNMTSLLFLDLSNNKLTGMLPQGLGNLGSLATLKLQRNSFRGHILQMCSGGNHWLQMIDLSYNQFQGMLPRSLANCFLLQFFNVENNLISDIFPSWLGALPRLKVLSLRSNRFHGIIRKPTTNNEFRELCVIDISNNAISGMLPSNYFDNWNCMKSVDQPDQTYLQQSMMLTSIQGPYSVDYSMTIFVKGIELNYLKTPSRLKLIDLSSNRFKGEIPAHTIGNLRGLHFLHLSNNTLTGHIPSSLGNLTALESLDLSQNQLSGKIPSNLAQLNFLAYFNVSHNQLWGPIPHGQQFDTFQDNSYQGNSGLCGKLLSKKCEDFETPTPPPVSIVEEDEDSGFQIAFDWYVVVPGVVSGLVIGVVTGNIFATKNHAWFVKTFSRRKQPRGIRRRRGHRT